KNRTGCWELDFNSTAVITDIAKRTTRGGRPSAQASIQLQPWVHTTERSSSFSLSERQPEACFPAVYPRHFRVAFMLSQYYG
ncbi:MAG: hypothetical protein KDI18_01150, partial [Gammaproteobacteria bacterium]|nr:hypothetical protein [Gammaproteobacteria bacterium]